MTRKERIKITSELYDSCIYSTEELKAEILDYLSPYSDFRNYEEIEEKIVSLFNNLLVHTLIVANKFARKNYKTYKSQPFLKIETYNAIQAKLHSFILSAKQHNDILNFFYHLCLLLNTEIYRVITYVILHSTKAEEFEIYGGENCIGQCNNHLYQIGKYPLPPYHPGCECIPIFYEEGDINENIN